MTPEELQDHISSVLEELDGTDYSELARIIIEEVHKNGPAPSTTQVNFENNGLGNVGQHIQANTINNLELS